MKNGLVRIELIASVLKKRIGDHSRLSSRHHHMKKDEKIQGGSSK